MKECPVCGTKCTEETKFCEQCGSPIIQSKKCQKCGTKASSNAKFCSECGTLFSHSQRAGKKNTDMKYKKDELHYMVLLIRSPHNKADVLLREIRSITGCGIEKGKELVDQHGAIILYDVTYPKARETKKRLQRVGAEVTIIGYDSGCLLEFSLRPSNGSYLDPSVYEFIIKNDENDDDDDENEPIEEEILPEEI